MTESEAIERLKCMRLFMQINDKASESKFLEEDYIANKMAIKALEEIQQYRAIGTVEECQMSKERMIPKKAIIGKVFKTMGYYQCPICGGLLMRNEKFCNDCGQRIGRKNDL